MEEYEEMMGNTRGNRRRSFQPRNTDTTGQKKDREGGATVKKNERKKSLGGGNLQSITDSSFADKEAEDDLFMYRQRLTDPEEISKRKKESKMPGMRNSSICKKKNKKCLCATLSFPGGKLTP